MLIKSVTIQGFKSYKCSVRLELTEGLNVIVGPNGAGKSNLMEAIKFALTEEYGRVNQKERVALQYNGKAQRDGPAMVEIEFDNVDRRLPFDTDTVLFRREFGAKKDKLCINNKLVPEVHSFLEAAGLTNPYFIVQQGKIAALAIASDSERLKILKDIAGLCVYDRNMNEHRNISKKLAPICQEIRQKTEDIRERIAALEKQKELLEKVSHLTVHQRSIEHVLHERGINNKKEAIAKSKEMLEHIRQEWARMVIPRNNKIESLCLSLDANKQNLVKENFSLDRRNLKKSAIDDDLQRLERELEQARQKLSDYEQLSESSAVEIREVGKSLKKLAKERKSLTTSLDQISTSYSDRFEKEKRAQDLYREAEAKLKSVQDRLKRFTEFKDKATRDKFLNTELRVFKKKKAELEKDIRQTKSLLEEKIVEKSELVSEQRRIQEEVQGFDPTFENVQPNIDASKSLLLSLSAKRNKMLERRSEYNQLLTALYEKELSLRSKLSRILGKAKMEGLASVEKILNQLWGDSQGDIGYYGTVISNISCGPEYETAIEVAAGPSLLYHIVRDHTISTRIMKEFNDQKLPGEVFFLSLDKVWIPPIHPFFQELQEIDFEYRRYEPVTLMLDHVRIEESDMNIYPGIHSIFGRSLLCLNTEIAGEAFRKHNVTCITLDGDKVSRGGAITGGYRNPSNRAIPLHAEWHGVKAKTEDYESKLEQLQAQSEIVQAEIDQELSKKEKMKLKKIRSKHNMESTFSTLKLNQSSLAALEQTITRETAHLSTLNSNLVEVQTKIEYLCQELTTALSKEPSPYELQQLQELKQQAKERSQGFRDTLNKRSELQRQKVALEDKLQALQKEEVDLNEKKQGLGKNWDGKIALLSEKVELLSRNISSKTRDLEQNLQVIPEITKSIQQMEDKVRNELAELETLRVEQTSEHPDVPAIEERTKLFEEEVARMEKERQGTVPTRVDQYSNKATKDLRESLKKVNRKLKNFAHVSLEDLALSQQMDEIKEELMEKETEFGDVKRELENLQKDLQGAKDSKLIDFFYQLQIKFREVFTELVPQGRGNLLLHGRNFRIDDMDEEDSSQLPEISEEELTGIGLQVSFVNSSVSSSTVNINQLSGGQKTITAVALILAIQMLDPVPIYLLDEIDAALDPAYRAAVAEIIVRLSAESQYICTTFRREFVNKAESHYGVVYLNSASTVQPIRQAEALRFVADDMSSDSGTAGSTSFDSGSS